MLYASALYSTQMALSVYLVLWTIPYSINLNNTTYDTISRIESLYSDGESFEVRYLRVRRLILGKFSNVKERTNFCDKCYDFQLSVTLSLEQNIIFYNFSDTEYETVKGPHSPLKWDQE